MPGLIVRGSRNQFQMPCFHCVRYFSGIENVFSNSVLEKIDPKVSKPNAFWQLRIRYVYGVHIQMLSQNPTKVNHKA